MVVSTVGPSDDSMLLAYQLLDRSSLDGFAPEQLTDALLAGISHQVGVMRSHR